MAPIRLAFCLAILSALLLSSPVSADEPILVYERTHAHPTSTENRMSLRVWSDGRAQIHFPQYMRHAGTYQRQLTSEEKAYLFDLALELSGIDQEQLDQISQPSRQQKNFLVMDADLVEIRYRTPNGEDVKLTLPSPSVYSRTLRDHTDIAKVAEAAQSYQQWMREHAQGGQP